MSMTRAVEISSQAVSPASTFGAAAGAAAGAGCAHLGRGRFHLGVSWPKTVAAMTNKLNNIRRVINRRMFFLPMIAR